MLAQDVVDLRNRVSFHNIRLFAVLKPLELSLFQRLIEDVRTLDQNTQQGLAAIDARLARLEGVISPNIVQETEAADQALTTLPRVPPFLRGRFAAAAEILQHSHVTDSIRLSSLIGHFAAFQQCETETPTSIVSLWKSVWLVTQLKSSATYPDFSSAKLNESIVKEYERLIVVETTRVDATSLDLLADAENLPQSEFEIWLFEPVTTHKNLVEPHPDEEKAFECSLVKEHRGQSHGLVVLASRGTPDALRVIETLVSHSPGGKSDHFSEFEIDVTKVKLFPTYIQPGATVSDLQVSSSTNARSDKVFLFRSLQNLHSFQQCLTSFYVELDLPGVTEVSYKLGGLVSGLARAQVIANYGRAQIWTHELSKEEIGDPISTNGTTAQSPGLRRNTLSSYEKSSQSASKTLVEWTSTHTPSVIWRGDTTELQYPETPLVVLPSAIIRQDSTDEETVSYRLLVVPLEGSVIIDKNRCKCRNHDDTCTRVIISSRSRLNAKLYEYGSDINAMNIAVLRRPQDHIDRKTHMKKLDDISRISIDFGNVQDKIDFRKRLGEIVDNYIGLWKDYRTQLNAIRKADVVDQKPQ